RPRAGAAVPGCGGSRGRWWWRWSYDSVLKVTVNCRATVSYTNERVKTFLIVTVRAVRSCHGGTSRALAARGDADDPGARAGPLRRARVRQRDDRAGRGRRGGLAVLGLPLLRQQGGADGRRRVRRDEHRAAAGAVRPARPGVVAGRCGAAVRGGRCRAGCRDALAARAVLCLRARRARRRLREPRAHRARGGADAADAGRTDRRP